MNKNDNTWIILVIAAFLLYSFLAKGKVDIIDNKIDKISKPDAQVASIIDNAGVQQLPNPDDTNKLSALYKAISDKWTQTQSNVNTNMKFQYFLASVGKKTVGTELLNPDGSKKYPNTAENTAKAITAAIGPQDDSSAMTPDEIALVGKLMDGLAWKFYNSKSDNVFEAYKPKALKAIDEYNGIVVPPVTEDECICNGSGFVVHGDGHQTPCPAKGTGKCKSEATTQFIPFPTDLPELDLGLEDKVTEKKAVSVQTQPATNYSRRRLLLRR